MDATAIILSGGKSSRMGQDKGLLRFNRQSLIEYTLLTVRKVTDKILIIANNNGYDNFGVPVYPDIYLDKGPAGGIHSGLTHSETHHNLVVACDMPFLPVELFQHIINNFEEGDEVVVPVYSGELQPLCAGYAKSCLPHFEANIRQGQRKLKEILKGMKTKYVTVDESLDFYLPDMFANVNTKADFHQLKHRK